MPKRYKLWFITLLSVMLIFASNAQFIAGQGDGSGGGQDQPLSLLSSTPADGAQDMAVDTQIKLSFNKNVVNMTVKDNNQKCFTLTADNQAVPFDVIMADDQVQPEGKRDVILRPRNGLSAGTKYLITISPMLQAKSGVVLGHEVKIAFSTAGLVKPAASNTGNKQPVAEESTRQIIEQQDTSTIPENKQAAAATSAEETSDTNVTSTDVQSSTTEVESDSEKDSHNGKSSSMDLSAGEKEEAEQPAVSSAVLILGFLIAVGAASLFYLKRK